MSFQNLEEKFIVIGSAAKLGASNIKPPWSLKIYTTLPSKELLNQALNYCFLVLQNPILFSDVDTPKTEEG